VTASTVAGIPARGRAREAPAAGSHGLGGGLRVDFENAIREYLQRNFFVAGALADDASLLDLGVIDSTGVLEVISFLESEFHIQVLDEEIVAANMDSVGRLAGFVRRKLEARRAQATPAA
jgi:acyl carrier protein